MCLSILAVCCFGALALADEPRPEYDLTPAEASAPVGLQVDYQALNPEQGLRVYFGKTGVALEPTVEGRAPWGVGLELQGYGYAGQANPVRDASLQVETNRIGYAFAEGLSAWYTNDPKGIQHAFVLNTAPYGQAPADGWPVELNFGTSGNLVVKVVDATSVSFLSPNDEAALQYTLRGARGANGEEIPAHLEQLTDDKGYLHGFRLVIEASASSYPITVAASISNGPPADAGDADASKAWTNPLPAQPTIANSSLVAANDTCATAEAVAAGGTSSLQSFIGNTDTGDPIPVCQANSHFGVWYTFTPATTGQYTIATCGVETATTRSDTILAVYTSSDGTCGGTMTQVAGACHDDMSAFPGQTCTGAGLGTPSTLQSRLPDLPLCGGTTYYILASSFSTTAPTAPTDKVQIVISAGTAMPVAAPANDTCAGAIAISPASFPVSTTLTEIAGATNYCGTNDFQSPNNSPCTFYPSRGIWYTFTPTTSGTYTFETCTPATGTTLPDTEIDLFTSAGGCAGPFTAVTSGCNDNGCGTLSTVSASLTALTTYYVQVAKKFPMAPTPPSESESTLVSLSSVQLRVSQLLPPANDTCPGAIPLTLNIPVTATNAGAANDYSITAPAAACFPGVGQATSTAVGRDTVYSFTALSAGLYSFRAQLLATGGNLAAYLSLPAGPAYACPATGGQTCDATLVAANRNTSTAQWAAEEVMCRSLAAGQKVYLFVDEAALVSTGGGYIVQVNPCTQETEANGTTATANSLAGACPLEGSITPAAEVDFFSLPPTSAGQRIFAMADGAAGSSNDFDVRVTNSADTLEYDDLNLDLPFGSLSPTADGTKATDATTYIRINHFSAGTISEPYRLYAVVRADSAAAVSETEVNDTLGAANVIPSGYISGTIGATADVDYYAITLAAGDLVFAGLDQDPGYLGTNALDGKMSLRDALDTVLVTAADSSSTTTSRVTPGVGLAATTPTSNGEGLAWRVATAGTYYIRVELQSGTITTAKPYLLSLTVNCTVPGCTSPSDCDDGNVCTNDGCSAGVCTHTNNTNPCASDGNACTDDVCSGGTCTHPNNTLACNDNNPCTSGDVCGGGSCAGTPNTDPCEDNNPCTTGNVCSGGLCGTFNTDDCSDGNPCTVNDACSGGVCVPGPFTSSPPVTYCNAASITIPDSGAGTPYPSNIPVTGALPHVCKVTVDLKQMNHTWPDDIDILLTAPGTTSNAVIMSDAGDNVDLVNTNITLSDMGATPLPDEAAIVSGTTYKPTNYLTGDVFPAGPPASSPPNNAALSVFNGSNPNGTWKLYVADDTAADVGSIAGGWCLNLTIVCVQDSDCNDGNVCTSDICFKGQCQHVNNTDPCDDGIACTLRDTCIDGVCTGTPVSAPPEVTGVIAVDETTFQWTAQAGVVYDVPRGVTGELPVGGGGSEICLANGISVATVSDGTDPATGVARWYLVRARIETCPGTYGYRSNLTERVTSVCSTATGPTNCVLRDDYFSTNPNAPSTVQFGTPDIPPIPAEFFYPGSNPFFGQVEVKGFGRKPELPLVDTIVKRSGLINLNGAPIGASQTVDIELVELSLSSIQPITVTGTQPPQPWLLALDLASYQESGTLTATKTHATGGTAQATVKVKPRAVFARLQDLMDLQGGLITPDDVQVRVLDYDALGLPSINMEWTSPMPWSSTPPTDGSFFCPNNTFYIGTDSAHAPSASGLGSEGEDQGAGAGWAQPVDGLGSIPALRPSFVGGLPPHVPPGSPGAAHFVCPPPPPPPGLCTYGLLGATPCFPFGGGCPAPPAGKLLLLCPAGGPGCPGPCPPFIIVVFPCPGGLCIAFYACAGCFPC